MTETLVAGLSVRFSAIMVLLLLVLPVARSQTADPDESEPAEPEAVEEIVVYGERSIIDLRFDVYRAEANLFEVFNKINSTDEFDVECEYVTRLETGRRKYHVCEPKYLRLHRADAAARQAQDGLNALPQPLSRVQRKTDALWAEMAALLSEHPELKEAVDSLASANNAYRAERERRRKD